MRIERASFGQDAWPTDAFRNYAADPAVLFLVALAGRTMVGYLLAGFWRSSVEIASIAVASRHRRRGVASLLFRWVLREAVRRHAKTIWLMVRPDNNGALRFYQRLGFVRTATVSAYYEDRSPAWRMRLELPPGR